MTLRVPIEGFSRAVNKILGSNEAFVHRSGRYTLATAAKDSTVVISKSENSVDTVKEHLHQEGLKTYDGVWSVDDDREMLQLPYIAAVSYRATSKKTGIWVSAYVHQPNEHEVVAELLHEFKLGGEIQEMTLEQFIEAAQVSVQIVPPHLVEQYMGESA